MNDLTFRIVAAAHNAAMRRGVLNMWTIYNRPTDFPNGHVARRFEIGRNAVGVRVGHTHATDTVVEGTLQDLRECFKHCGLLCMARHKSDDPKIVETWM